MAKRTVHININDSSLRAWAALGSAGRNSAEAVLRSFLPGSVEVHINPQQVLSRSGARDAREISYATYQRMLNDGEYEAVTDISFSGLVELRNTRSGVRGMYQITNYSKYRSSRDEEGEYWTVEYFEYKGRSQSSGGKIKYKSEAEAKAALRESERNGWKGSVARWAPQGSGNNRSRVGDCSCTGSRDAQRREFEDYSSWQRELSRLYPNNWTQAVSSSGINAYKKSDGLRIGEWYGSGQHSGGYVTVPE